MMESATGVTHVIVAAIHVNNGPGNITLHGDPMDSPKYTLLWEDVKYLQSSNVKVLGMLGGASIYYVGTALMVSTLTSKNP